MSWGTSRNTALPAANTGGGFRFVKLPRMDGIEDWAGIPACISIGGRTPPACGSMLMDTGVPDMYMTAPAAQVPAIPLPAGTSVAVRLGDERASLPLYTFTVGDPAARLAPAGIFLHTAERPSFVNTGFHLLYGYDYLFDADGGYAAFRPR